MNTEKKKVRSMTVVYRVENGLYINLTNKCSNRCSFCIRNNGDGAYGSDSLWLLREPSAREVIEELEKWDIPAFSEVVFCGYGEPTYRIDTAREVALYIKAKHPKTYIRINTNGHSDLINGKETAPLFAGAFDCVSVSLNTPSADRYQEICQPVYKKDAFYALLDFAKKVKKFVPLVQFSVVRQTLTENELRECERIAEEIGVLLKVRDYIAG